MRKLVRDNELIPSVEGILSRRKRDRDLDSVQKLCSKGEISMLTLDRKLNWLFKETAQFRKII